MSCINLGLFSQFPVPLTTHMTTRYRPLMSSGFINEFSKLLSIILPRYDRIKDFNIHICCTSNSLNAEFLSLIASFNLSPLPSGQIHRQGHILDLVLSYGLTLSDLNCFDPGLFDYYCISFNLVLPPFLIHSYGLKFLTPPLLKCLVKLLEKFLPPVSQSPYLHLQPQ